MHGCTIILKTGLAIEFNVGSQLYVVLNNIVASSIEEIEDSKWNCS